MKECEHCKTEMEPCDYIVKEWKNIGRIKVCLSTHYAEVDGKKLKGNAWICLKCGRIEGDFLALQVADEIGERIVRQRLIAMMAAS